MTVRLPLVVEASAAYRSGTAERELRAVLAGRPFDTVSAVLSAGLFGGMVLGADLISRGVGLAFGAVLLAGAAVCAVLVVRRVWDQPAPLFPVDLLRIPIFGL